MASRRSSGSVEAARQYPYKQAWWARPSLWKDAICGRRPARRRRFSRLLLAALLGLVVQTASADEGGAFSGPPDAAEMREERSGFNPAAWLIRIFRDHVSAVDSDRCPSYPSCSHYSVQALEKHGIIMGWMMVVDRLIHEGAAEEQVSGRVLLNGRYYIHDPLSNNDFWWYRPDDEE